MGEHCEGRGVKDFSLEWDLTSIVITLPSLRVQLLKVCTLGGLSAFFDGQNEQKNIVKQNMKQGKSCCSRKNAYIKLRLKGEKYQK